MSNTVFPFVVLRPYVYPAQHETTRQELNNGYTLVRAEFSSYGRYRVGFRTRLPYSSETNETWQAFLRTMQGGMDMFLFKDRKTELFYKRTSEAVGTGDGSTTAFALDCKHIDSSTLAVTKNGVAQTGGGTDYTFSGNNTAPIITFNSAPTAGHAIVATYEFYMPVRFANDPVQGTYLGGDSNVGDIAIELEETNPGAHRV